MSCSPQGHAHGYKRLIDALGWCLDLSIEVVSVYAFSVENFKRSKDEVDTLMELAAAKLRSLLTESFDMLERHQVSVRVIGDLELLPRDVQRAAAEVMIATSHNKRAVLNICLAYTGRSDMRQALKAVQVSASKQGSSILPMRSSYVKTLSPKHILVKGPHVREVL